ncbi:amidase [Streptomyces sp. NPDC059627]
MTDVERLVQMPAFALIEWYRQGRASPVEVVRALLERAQEYRDINALLAIDAERSLAEAEQALRCYREGNARPLEGVPVAVKDLIDTAGLETTYGSSIFAGHVPDRDATAVQRVRAAGGIVIAKTTTHEFAWGITTDGSVSGPARNPWGLGMVPGGSSGGSAAALAVGLAPLAIGTDTAGSIRIPAAFCGVSGLKPTFGTVPTAGVFPLAPSLDTVGPMARTVEDLELLLSVMAPGTVAEQDPQTPRTGPVVGVWEQSHQAACSSEVAGLFHAAVSAMAEAGADVRSVTSSQLPALYSTLAATVAAEGIIGHRRAGLWPKRRADYHPAVRHRLEQASGISVEQYAQAQQERALLTAMTARVLGTVDVLLTPVAGVSPAAIGHDSVVDDAQAQEFRERVMTFTALQSLTGVPACTVRVGFDNKGLPVGVQLTAAWGRERTLLAAARLLVSALPTVQQRWPDAPVRDH